MIATYTETAQLFPVVPATPAGISSLGTSAYLLKNSRLGIFPQVSIWEPRLLIGNHQNALGLRADIRQTRVRSRCSGKERDSETNLDYFGARYYSGAQGRFATPDEFKGGIVDPFTGQDIETNTALPYADITDPQTLNKYAYVRNNPLRYVDPDGHEGEDTLVDVAIEEVDKVVRPLIESAGTKAATGVSFLARGLGIVAGVILNPAQAAGQDEIRFEAANGERNRQWQQQGSTENQERQVEPEVATGGAGARSGGGKTGRKINQDRATSARDTLASLQDQLKALQSTPNKTPATKEKLKSVQGQINRQRERLKKSEEHARQEQR